MVWNQFIKELSEENTQFKINRDSFFDFKKQLLEQMDEDYIKEMEARYLNEL